jgi:hypothetical protein
MLLVTFTKLVPWALISRKLNTLLAYCKGRDEANISSEAAGIESKKNRPKMMTMMRAFPIIPPNFIGLRL